MNIDCPKCLKTNHDINDVLPDLACDDADYECIYFFYNQQLTKYRKTILKTFRKVLFRFSESFKIKILRIGY